MNVTRVVLATGNAGKVKEMQSYLEEYGIEVLPQSEFDVPEVAETGTTFVENAIIKARHAAQHTGLPAIADDSGLAVDALGGAPGVYSARYAGQNATDQDNIDKLLQSLGDNEQRKARFICSLVFMQSHEDPIPFISLGQWEGSIVATQQGEGGFGYDPVFWVEEKQRTAAELSKAEKHALSHRGQALKPLIQHLAALKG
ncbi:XTP/dITP diphosphatase [Algicola sagamiensis]|uniref:XTP/dITP diphosphatase n=1 Tax=Algicola sagamiensis TaxID=163869 RepID=UPI000368D771|nr:XTP/dITP diphosphatase [Algicola sagamiensis]